MAKIGLSFSRCVKDIVDGVVDIDDVLVVIARTKIDPRNDDQWLDVWLGYREAYGMGNPEWAGYSDEDEDRVRSVSIELWESGKLHQPRQFGAHAARLSYYWLETILPDKELESNPAVKKAWDQFKLISQLSKTHNKDIF
jgi:hypothetical protein